MELWLAVLMVVGMITPMVYYVILLREENHIYFPMKSLCKGIVKLLCAVVA